MTEDRTQRKPRTRQTKAKENEGRPKRIPIGSTLKLAIPPEFEGDDTHHYHWFADRDGKIPAAKRALYEHVLDERGNPVKYEHATDMYLMRLPIEYWEDDQKLKNDKIIDTLKAEQKMRSDEYIPEGKKAPLQKDADLLDPLA